MGKRKQRQRIQLEDRGVNSLKTISRLPPKCKKRRHLIRNLSSKVVKKLSETVHNLLKGRVPLSPSQYKKLKKHQKSLKRFKNKSLSIKKKKHLLQRGGFLTPLLAAAIPILSSILK